MHLISMQFTKRSIFITFILTAIFAFTNKASATEVLFSGFSFTGQYDQREQLYPWATKLSAEATENGSILDVSLREALQGFKSSNINLITDQAAKVGKGPSVTLAFGLGRESVEEVKSNTDVISIYRVMTRIVAFDWEEKKLIASFPVQVVYQNVTTSSPTFEQHLNIFKKMYTDQSFDGNVFKAWVARLGEVEIKDKYGLYFGISDVSLDDGARNQLPQTLTESSYKSLVAQTLESTLSQAQKISVVPFTSGESVGRNMAMRFSDATTLNLTLPDPDYTMNITVKEFKNVEKVKGRVRKIFVASYINSEVTLNDSDFKKTYFNADMKHINAMVFSTTDDVKIDYWSTYQTALRTLLSRFAIQISEKDPEILKSMSPKLDLKKPFEKLETVLEKCR